MGEFDLIRRYFMRPAQGRGANAACAGGPDAVSRTDSNAVDDSVVRLGIGDDCAVLAPRPGYELAISTDMLVAGRHFLPEVDAAALGWKSLAVNLSDLAAMGAQPLAFTLALALPDATPAWLEKFSSGLFECADRYGCTLIGGDTTRGPLNICITVFGEVPARSAIRRDGARAGADVWISGCLGDAALGLRLLRAEAGLDDLSLAQRTAAIEALERPQPRVALGLALRGIATSMIDLSDGLLGDLAHMLKASGQLGAVIDVDALPVSDALKSRPQHLRLHAALAGGDDYELCFTVAPDARAAVMAAAARAGVAVSRIGRIEAGGALRLVDGNGKPLATGGPDLAAGAGIDGAMTSAINSATDLFKGYDHFA